MADIYPRTRGRHRGRHCGGRSRLRPRDLVLWLGLADVVLVLACTVLGLAHG
jgi:hypothetical protein